MDECLDSYLEYSALEKKLASRTIKAYNNDLGHFNRWLTVNGIVLSEAAAADIAEYMAFLSSSGFSPVSIIRKLSSIRGFFRFMQSSGQRIDNPTELLHSPRQPVRLPHAVSVETVAALIDVWEGDSPVSTRNRALLELAYGAGLRESELTGMTVSRIYLEDALVRPFGKGSRERLVPIGGTAVRWLSLYIDTARPLLAHGKSTPVLFLTYRGNPLSRMTVWNIVRRSAEMAGIQEHIHPHILRHSFATHLLRGGADLRVVQELLGHADIKTTEIYTSVDVTYLRGIVDRYHPRSGEV
ncbi:MAG: tyrosine recombinase XerD [Candidatus Aegiribacteria sp.]|nr:tyrosine recombinase XerD [Candidatus Aegiribacteria sp.]